MSVNKRRKEGETSEYTDVHTQTYVPGILFKVSFKRIIAFAAGKAEVYRDISQRAPSPSLFSVLFCDEIPLDTIKSLPESPLKLHNYRNTKKTPQSSSSGALH